MVGVVEVFRVGFVWVREPDSCNVCGPILADSEELGEALLCHDTTDRGWTWLESIEG